MRPWQAAGIALTALAAGCSTTPGGPGAGAESPAHPVVRSAVQSPGGEDGPEDQVDLAAEARDPTAAVTAFQIRYDWNASFHNLPDADQTSLVLQPIIPWKWGEQPHIARVTVPYVTNGPDWGLIADDPGVGVPPNNTPSGNQTGLGDTALVDLFIYEAPWEGRWGIGGAAIVPTASDPALGSEKWSIGPAVVGIVRAGALQYGALGQWLFSVAGDDSRDDINILSLQPFASYGLDDGWSVGTSEIVLQYNLDAGGWTSVPIGGRVEKLARLGKLPTRFYVDAEYNFADTFVAPEWTLRFAVVPLF